MLTSRVATTATRINYRRHFSTDVSFEQTHPNSRQRVSRKVIVINWRRLRIRENEKERKEISKRDSYPNFSSMEEKNFSEGIWMELCDQRGTEERKKERNFALVTCPLLFFSESPRPDALLAIEFFRGRRKARTLFDHRSGRWPGFDDTKVYETLSLLLRLRNLRIAGFLYRAFSNRTVFRNIGRGKAVLENNDILSRTSLSSCFPWERLQDFLTELLYLYIRISMHIRLSATTSYSDDKSDTITDGLNGWRKDAGDLELERRSCVGLLNDWIGIDRGSNFIYYCSPRYIYIYIRIFAARSNAPLDAPRNSKRAYEVFSKDRVTRRRRDTCTSS